LMFLDQDVESMYFLKSFFFQAEDGIRDRNVTGVQTCALPISPRVVPWVVPVQVQPAVLPPARQVIPQPTRSVAPQAVPRAARPEIGRATCRDSEWKLSIEAGAETARAACVNGARVTSGYDSRR